MNPFIRFSLNRFKRHLIALLVSFGLLLLSQPAQAAPPQLKINGSAIVNASSGCTVRLRGVDIDGLEFGVNDANPSGILATATEAIDTWKSNFIRLPLNQDRWFFYPDSYPAMVDQLVSLCSLTKLLHYSRSSLFRHLQFSDYSPNGSGWGTATGQQEMADYNAVTFWSSVAARYKNNPAVFFDLYNEPYTLGASAWYSGGSAGSFNTPGMNALLTAVRNTVPTIFVLPGVSTGATIWQAFCPTTNFRPPVEMGFWHDCHIYSNNANQTVNVSTTTYPVMVGEFGPCATCGTAAFTQNFISSVLDPGNLSWTAWNMSVTNSPPLLSSWTGYSPTSYHGQYVYNSLTGMANPSCDSAIGGATYTPTPVPTEGNCFMLSNFSQSPYTSAPYATNNLNGSWSAYNWESLGSGAPETSSPMLSYASCPATNLYCTACLSSAVAGPNSETYSAFVSGGYSENGTSSPATYCGFGLQTDLQVGYTNLNWVTNFAFYVRTTVAPVTLRFQLNNPSINQEPITWQGQYFACGGNGNQYGQNFVVNQANTWILESFPINAMEFQDWNGGDGDSPPHNSAGVTMWLSQAITQVLALQWETQGGPTTFGMYINDVCLSGSTLPITPTPSAVAKTSTFTPTRTPTVALTNTNTVTTTRTNTASPSPSQTSTSSNTPTKSSTPSVTATLTATVGNTLTFTSSPTNTITPTPTYTRTMTPTATLSSTGTVTPTASSTSSRTSTSTYTSTATSTSTLSGTPTATTQFSATNTLSPTATPTQTTTKTSTVPILPRQPALSRQLLPHFN